MCLTPGIETGIETVPVRSFSARRYGRRRSIGEHGALTRLVIWSVRLGSTGSARSHDPSSSCGISLKSIPVAGESPRLQLPPVHRAVNSDGPR